MIWGKLDPKMVTGTGDVVLEYAVLHPTFASSEFLEHISPLNGQRNFLTLGDYSKFDVMIHLWKYPDPATAFQTFYGHKDELVKFYPYKEGDPISNIIGDPIDFYLAYVEGAYLQNLNQYDICKLSFISSKYHRFVVPDLLGYGFDYGQNYGYSL